MIILYHRIVGRFGLDLKKEKTQREIAKELSISCNYVSRIEKRAPMKMFHKFIGQRRRKGRKRVGCIFNNFIYIYSFFSSAFMMNMLPSSPFPNRGDLI
ncbi:hypothetical protein BSI_11820 [Bacillus inaquosorum KCTC 13429]|uniref:RNA polymerase sigma-70 region 4 domain-containing protein n=1 Tax=Bacillus inaquosorum KCTC 13429 TaxID=1236548 RepID=A0A9W5PDQ5_9BACI|nr:hypothetical protein BSI_11820 [Bacillus inaquosorum KCTC 13429]